MTPKQARFVQEYLVDLNAAAAADRAGYSRKTAAQMAYRLLQREDIQTAIQQARDDRQRRTGVTQDYVIEKLKEIADKAASDDTGSELKYANKLKALELLGKHVGVFERGGKVEHTQEDDPLTASLKEWMKHHG